MTSLRLTLRISLPNGSRLGPGKIALLEAVRQHRSIAAAARDLDMSYRRAWLLIDDLNRAFTEPVVATFPGRSHGAGTAVTPFGERLIGIYRDAEQRSIGASASAIAEIGGACNSGYAAGALKRCRRTSDAGGA
jgi:molybdate transport system regulatory protein